MPAQRLPFREFSDRNCFKVRRLADCGARPRGAACYGETVGALLFPIRLFHRTLVTSLARTKLFDKRPKK